jgi:hypothetical protein
VLNALIDLCKEDSVEHLARLWIAFIKIKEFSERTNQKFGFQIDILINVKRGEISRGNLCFREYLEEFINFSKNESLRKNKKN